MTAGTNATLVVSGVTTWSSASIDGVTCPQVTACIAVGERQRGDRRQAFFVEQSDGDWSAPIPLGPWVADRYTGQTSVACSDTVTCMTAQPEMGSLTLISPLDGHALRTQTVFQPISEQIDLGVTACSAAGFCWTLVSRTTPPSKHRLGRIWDYVVGEHDGRWLAPYPVGGPALRVGGQRPVLLLSRDLSCWSPTSCTVAAYAGSEDAATIVQTEVNGSWGPATVVPGSEYSPKARGAPHFQISAFPPGPGLLCTSSGTCLLGGEVTNSATLQTGAIEQEIEAASRQVV